MRGGYVSKGLGNFEVCLHARKCEGIEKAVLNPP